MNKILCILLLVASTLKAQYYNQLNHVSDTLKVEYTSSLSDSTYTFSGSEYFLRQRLDAFTKTKLGADFNILDTAVLVFFGDNYTTGKSRAYKPFSPAGDFDFTRTDSASYINAAGDTVYAQADILRCDFSNSQFGGALIESGDILSISAIDLPDSSNFTIILKQTWTRFGSTATYHTFNSGNRNAEGRINLFGGNRISYFSTSTGYLNNTTISDVASHYVITSDTSNVIKFYENKELQGTGTNTSSRLSEFSFSRVTDAHIHYLIILPFALTEAQVKLLN